MFDFNRYCQTVLQSGYVNFSSREQVNMGDAFGALKQEEIPQEEIENCEVYYTDLLPKEPALAGLIAAKKQVLQLLLICR